MPQYVPFRPHPKNLNMLCRPTGTQHARRGCSSHHNQTAALPFKALKAARACSDGTSQLLTGGRPTRQLAPAAAAWQPSQPEDAHASVQPIPLCPAYSYLSSLSLRPAHTPLSTPLLCPDHSSVKLSSLASPLLHVTSQTPPRHTLRYAPSVRRRCTSHLSMPCHTPCFLPTLDKPASPAGTARALPTLAQHNLAYTGTYARAHAPGWEGVSTRCDLKRRSPLAWGPPSKGATPWTSVSSS